MAPNLNPLSAPARSVLPEPSPPSLDLRPCRRFASLPNVDGRSLLTSAPSRTSYPALVFVSVSSLPGDGDSSASWIAFVCSPPWASRVCKRGSFFWKPVRHFAQFLGHMEAI